MVRSWKACWPLVGRVLVFKEDLPRSTLDGVGRAPQALSRVPAHGLGRGYSIARSALGLPSRCAREGGGCRGDADGEGGDE